MTDNGSIHIDKALLVQVAEGQEAAFTVLFKTVLPGLQAAVRKIVQSEEGMKEVIQETFIRVWMNRDQLVGLDKPVHWIFRVASNECFTFLRKSAIRERLQTQLASGHAGEDSFHTGLDDVSLKETQQLIHKAVAQLTPQKRLIYQMSRNEGLKTAEIAEKLQLSHSHVRNSLSSSLQFIRGYLIAAGKIMALTAVFLK
ncbi:MAG TPA: sigma-70 family RNA polymerase sigma factor [Puia sp.]|nr:sigma-70 family RNA polymerase sigma factor [Puia sp.]